MERSSPCLDLARLENVRHTHPDGKITARCPACAEEEHDRTGNHLAIFPSGKFTCIADPGHRRRVWELVGMAEGHTPKQRTRHTNGELERVNREKKRMKLEALARDRRTDLVKNYRWHPADLWETSPTRPNEAADDPRFFLSSLFQPDAIVWTGEVFESGERYRNRWRSVGDWFNSPLSDIGPMTAPTVWKPDTVSRSKDAISSAPYVVLDFDGQDGQKPTTALEINRHLAESLALVQWLRGRLKWRLAAILSTGGKSIHAWFDDPGPVCLDSLRPILSPFGVDAGLIGHPEHPCRLPGQVHRATGKRSRVLWLR